MLQEIAKLKEYNFPRNNMLMPSLLLGVCRVPGEI